MKESIPSTAASTLYNRSTTVIPFFRDVFLVLISGDTEQDDDLYKHVTYKPEHGDTEQDDDLCKHVTYKPEHGDTLVKSARETIYYERGFEGMHAAIDTYLVGITWVLKASWNNSTGSHQTFVQELKNDFKVVKGQEVTKAVPIASVYDRMTVLIGGHPKSFERTGTAPSTVYVAPYSCIYLYQKRYTFRHNMYFILDAWAKEWNVGAPKSKNIARKECIAEIMVQEFVTLPRELDGKRTGTVQVSSVVRAHSENVRQTKQHGESTNWCRKRLAQMGF
jgi:hypothetical protein